MTRTIVPLSLMLGLLSIASLAHADTLTLNNGSDYFVYYPLNPFGPPFPPNTEVMEAAAASAAMTMTGGGAGYPGVIMLGGSGNDTMIAGTASGSFTGGSGNNIFEIGAGTDNASSTYIITDFNANDSVILGGTFTAAQMLANATVTNGATTLKLSNGALVTFQGITDAATLNGHVTTGALTLPASGAAPTTVTATGYTITGTLQGELTTPVGDQITNGSNTALTVSGNSVTNLSITASGGGFALVTAAGDTLSGEAGTQTITSSAGNFTFSGTVNNQTLTLGAGTRTITGTAANLNLDDITNLRPGDQIVVTGSLFTNLLYNSATGVLQLDTSHNGSFATTLQLSAGLAGNFQATESSVANNYTTVALVPPTYPQLSITRSGNEVIVSWPTSVTGWTLQTNFSLGTGIWGNYTGNTSNNSATNSLPNGNLFFRLIQP